MVCHEVRGPNARVVGIQLDGCRVSCMAAGGMKGVNKRLDQKDSMISLIFIIKMKNMGINYPFPHLGLGLSDRNMGRNRMKSSPSGLCFPL